LCRINLVATITPKKIEADCEMLITGIVGTTIGLEEELATKKALFISKFSTFNNYIHTTPSPPTGSLYISKS